jgi:AraC-like DNA-binding protein
MPSTWLAGNDELGIQFAIAGSFGDVALHHHPAVQVAVGLDGPIEITTDDGVTRRCRAVAIAGGTRHALGCPAGVTPISLYLRPDTGPGAGVNARAQDGIWMLDDAVGDVVATVFAADGLHAAARRLATEVGARTTDRDGHPQLRQAIDLLRADPAGPVDLVSTARAVALSPDHLGRLFKTHTGASFSATARWLRLLAGLDRLRTGLSVTDAAHAAGFTDGAHANRVCWELLGGAPSRLARALAE